MDDWGCDIADFMPDWFLFTDWNRYLWENQKGEEIDIRTISPGYAHNLRKFLDREFDDIQYYAYYCLTDGYRNRIENSNFYQALVKKGSIPNDRRNP